MPPKFLYINNTVRERTNKQWKEETIPKRTGAALQNLKQGKHIKMLQVAKAAAEDALTATVSEVS